jgi:meso-butanediol dehydrogenase/(S,S)-butanediol dehydrogenase/diacetyl reductase
VRFEGKRVLVTGAASGIGAATAALFAREGAEVVALDQTEAPGVHQIDVTDSAAVAAKVRDSGPFDVVANIAGMVRLGHTVDVPLEVWQKHLDVNLTAPFVISQAALPGLLERKGNIVNVASVAGLKGQAYSAAYCASKAGVVMLTKSMALELAKQGVRVNCVCPGQVSTPLVKGVAETMPTDVDWKLVERLMNVAPNSSKPEEIAEAIAYLASDVARSVTGTALSIDGGTIS